MLHKIVCALDTGDLQAAIASVGRLAPRVRTFKIGHALTMPHGLDVISRLQDAGAERIFLDLKFHDIPNSVALAVREAGRRGVWMTTLHASGGTAMMSAAVEEARAFGEGTRPLLVGVAVLTSIDEKTLREEIGVSRGLTEQVAALGELACRCDLDGMVCSAAEIAEVRDAVGKEGIVVVPGIRMNSGPVHDQKRVGDPAGAIAAGADYLVIGRALAEAPDPEAILTQLAAL